MPTSPLPRLLLMGLFVVHTMAGNCCWRDSWGNSLQDTGYGNRNYNYDTLWLTWDEPAQVVRCGLSGNFQPGTKCSVATFKDENGNLNALTNITFGSDPQPFQFRLGINPGSCDPLPNDKVVTGWEGWGVFMWEGHEFATEPLGLCNTDHSA
ncbi:hypothetical protein GCG54_00013365 [Colletotrichum gloeosporioides]|uniref:Uncharacterized protein n=2 Tax=Colletotrichum gloeosporioides TaxID=474922 RepID=A0A8H4CG27_COLGL|nr:uncharacterized protein GCG54_00013365 [Colletotrichum gloeosporioides]KAF3803258.1 hypothetical protein GCG54_00013365 [Colletotrichum gloeosporioides]